jgi:GTP-binding protein HflX
LENELEKLSRRGMQRRARRRKTEIPILSLIGYTNAGKSTLFNLLTKNQFNVEDRLFTTLDTATRRLRFPRDHEVVITDTVGFIKDLPRDLIGAFRPTFGELQESDLLIHLVDISNPFFRDHIEAVEEILSELELNCLPRLLVFNKEDKMDPREVEVIRQKYDGISISAHRPESLERLFLAIERKLWRKGFSTEGTDNVKLTNGESFDISNKNFLMEVRRNDGNPV